MTDKLTQHHLTAERIADEDGEAIRLTQQEDSCYDPDTIVIHPWQLRAVCEQLAIIPSDQQSAKTIATLTRRLGLLRDRIDHLASYLANHPDAKHADLSYEQTYATATADLANEFCEELEAYSPPLQSDRPAVPEQTGKAHRQLELTA